MSLIVSGGTGSGGGANFPGGDLCSGTGTTVAVGAGLTLAGGALSANNPFPGPVSDLLAADGTSVTVGSGLTLAAGTLAASGGGGGITELTGEVTAGPASGSTGATVRGITGNAGGVLGYFRIPVQNYAYFQAPTAGYTPISWDVTGAQEVRIGCLEAGGYGQLPYARVQVSTQATISLTNCLPNFMSARMFVYGAQAVIQGGLQVANHIRVTGGTIAVDDANRLPNTVGYYIECAYPAGSGVTIVMPATPWPASFPNSAGRTIVVTDVLGTCSVADPITLVDPTGRTFNGSAGPYQIDKANNVCTITLDSTLNNWILGFQHGSPF